MIAHEQYESFNVYHLDVMANLIFVKKIVKCQDQKCLYQPKDLIWRNIHLDYQEYCTVQKFLTRFAFSKRRSNYKVNVTGLKCWYPKKYHFRLNIKALALTVQKFKVLKSKLNFKANVKRQDPKILHQEKYLIIIFM